NKLVAAANQREELYGVRTTLDTSFPQYKLIIDRDKLKHFNLNEYSCTSDEVRKNIERLYKKAYENFYKYCENKNGLAKSGKP
ncbi:hypothetical protein VWN77_10985, partial [Campylobacter coli]